MRKKTLEKRMARLQAKLQKLVERCNASADANEVRELTEQLEDVNAEIAETQEELDSIAEDEKRSAEPAQSAVPAGATLVNGTVKGSFKAEERSEDAHSSLEYRKAFMAYVQRGTAIPMELRAAGTISTADTSVMIPTTIMNEVINTVKSKYGNLYSKVRKLNVPGGVDFPIGALKASFKWINESTVSPRQKTDKLGKVQFTYNTLELRVSQTFLSKLLTLSAFEAELTQVIANAYLEAMDKGIVAGSGDGAMLGILNDARVTNYVEFTAAEIIDWKKWKTKFFAKLPLGYRSGEFIFPISTVEANLGTMSDNNGNPVFKTATGLELNEGNQVGRFFGREISLVEEDIIGDFDTASDGDVIGIYWQPEEYAINENFGLSMSRYFDQDTNEWVDKAITVVDGKVLNPTGYYLIKKKV